MEVNTLIKANEDFEPSMREIERRRRSPMIRQTIVENRSDVQRKGLVERVDHQNFDQHYRSNLNEKFAFLSYQIDQQITYSFRYRIKWNFLF